MLNDIMTVGLILLRNHCDPQVMAKWLALEEAKWVKAELAEASK